MVSLQSLINENKKISGNWTFKSRHRKKYQGTLSLGSEGIKIELYGDFDEHGKIWIHDELKGVTNEGVFILKKCYKRNYQTTLGKTYDVLTLEPSDIVFFEHHENTNNTDVTSLSTEIPYLVHWVDFPLFDQDILAHKVTYEHRKEYSFVVHDFKVIIGTHLPEIHNWSRDQANRLVIEQKGYIRLSFSNKVSYETAVSRFREIEALFRFIYLQQFFVRNFQGYTERRTGKSSAIISKQIYLSRIVKRDIVMPFIIDELFIFKLSDCEDFGRILSRWIELKDQIEPVYQLMLISNEPTMYIENRFMGLVNACELFHRSFMPTRQELRPYDEWAAQKAEILQYFTGKTKKLVKGMLK